MVGFLVAPFIMAIFFLNCCTNCIITIIPADMCNTESWFFSRFWHRFWMTASRTRTVAFTFWYWTKRQGVWWLSVFLTPTHHTKTRLWCYSLIWLLTGESSSLQLRWVMQQSTTQLLFNFFMGRPAFLVVMGGLTMYQNAGHCCRCHPNIDRTQTERAALIQFPIFFAQLP